MADVAATEQADRTLNTNQPASTDRQDIEMGGITAEEVGSSDDTMRGAIDSKTG